MRRRSFAPTLIAVLLCLLLASVALAQDVPPGPTVVYQTTMKVTNPPAAFDLINIVLDFAPGAGTPIHYHDARGIVTVLKGEIVQQPAGGAEQRLRAGQSFLESPGRRHRVANPTRANARILFTALLPKGAHLTTVPGTPQTPAQPGTLPDTGARPPSSIAWLGVIVGASLLVGGRRLRRRSRSVS